MKRGADKQLTKDDSDEDVGEDGPGTGFKKAEDTVLATRKIRGLPRRSAAATPSGSSTPEPSAAPDAAPAPKFAGFGGFGGFGTSSATPFTFAAAKPSPAPALEPSPPVATTTAPSTAPVSLFGSSTARTAAWFAPTSTSAPTVAPTASNATKTFASFLSSSTEPKPVNGTHKPQEAPEEDEKFQAEKQYYLALRGLNVAFVDAITKAVDEDPFLDLADTYERYKTLRAGVKEDYEKKSKPTLAVVSRPSGSANGTPSASDSFSFATPPTLPSGAVVKAPPAMPAPPPLFSGFGQPAASTSSTSSSGGGFKFDSSKSTDSGSSAKSVFSFPPPASTTSDSSSLSKPAELASSTSSAAGAAFGPSFTPSVFGSNIFGSNTSGRKSFGSTGNPKSETKDGFHADDNPFVSPFGATASSKSGDKGASAAPLFGGTASSETTTKSAPLFGTPTASSPSENADKPPAPLFGLGAPSSGFAFGGGSSAFGGKPVGFGFGNVSKSDEAKPAASSSSAKPAAFSWPAPSAAPAAAATEGGDTAAADEDAPVMKLSGPSVHDADGEGEEDEETNHQIRAKVFKLTKKADGSQSWTDFGVGLLKVKAHKENDTRRLLLRNSSTGKVVINFNIYKAMDPSVAKNVVSFMGHDDGTSMPYKIRVKTEAVASELKAALDREIEFVKAKSSD